MGLGFGLAGAGLGGILGGLSNPSSPNFVNPNFIDQFNVNGVGSSTNSGFKSGRSRSFMDALRTAEGSLNPLLQQILNSNSTGNGEKFQNAFINARRPQLEQSLQQQRQRLNANIASQGLAGSSSSIFAQGQQGKNANQQRNELFNQGILGGQALQQQDLQNLLAKFGSASNLSQQNFGNTLQSALGLGGLLNQNNQSEINKANSLNGIAQARNASSGNLLKSILSGAIGGAGIGNLFTGAGGFDFGSLFGGGTTGVPSSLDSGGSIDPAILAQLGLS